MIFDLFFIVTICIFATLGYKKGMLYSLFSIFGITLSLFLAYLISPIVISSVCKLLNGKNLMNAELDNLPCVNGNILSFAKYVISANGLDLRSISLYTLIVMLSYSLVLIAIKFVVSKLIRLCFYGCCKNIPFAKYDRFFGVFCGTAKGLIFVFLLSIVVIIAKSISLFDNNVMALIDNSSLIGFSYNIFNCMIM